MKVNTRNVKTLQRNWPFVIVCHHGPQWILKLKWGFQAVHDEVRIRLSGSIPEWKSSSHHTKRLEITFSRQLPMSIILRQEDSRTISWTQRHREPLNCQLQRTETAESHSTKRLVWSNKTLLVATTSDQWLACTSFIVTLTISRLVGKIPIRLTQHVWLTSSHAFCWFPSMHSSVSSSRSSGLSFSNSCTVWTS